MIGKIGVVVVFLGVIPSLGYSAFWNNWKPEISLLKASVADNADALVKADVKVGENCKTLADVKAEIGDVKVQMAAQGTAIVGVGNDVKTLSVGRDNIVVNDSKLLEEIFKGLFALMTAVCVGLFTALKAKEKHIQALLVSNQKKQDKQDVWERGMIDKLSFGNKEVDKLLDESKSEVRDNVG